MDAAVAALLGAAIGTVGSFGALWLQLRHQNKRERVKLAADLGLADHNSAIENSRQQQGRFEIAPLSAYVMYHAEFLDALEKNEVTPEVLQRLLVRQQQLMEQHYDYTKKAGGRT